MPLDAVDPSALDPWDDLDPVSARVVAAFERVGPAVLHVTCLRADGRPATAILGHGQGICFAVGVDTATFVAARLIRDGRVRRARLGLAAQTVPISRRVARHFGLIQTHAALVSEVLPDSAAARAGLVAGDLLVGFAGAPVPGADGLHALLGDEPAGKVTTLDVVRGTARLALAVVPDLAG